MKIPVFVSCPTKINSTQKEAKDLIYSELDVLQLEPRSLGKTDYPAELPLREVFAIAKHCSGGIILGFTQFKTNKGTWIKTDTPQPQKGIIAFPTPWNQLEAGILYGVNFPLLIFREPFIEGGVFDEGVTDVYIHPMPAPPLDQVNENALREVFLKWSAKVRGHYYGK